MEQSIDVTCPMLADDLNIAAIVADRLGVAVPDAFSLAIRLLGECECNGVLRSDGESNFIIARCRQPGGLPDSYRRVHF